MKKLDIMQEEGFCLENSYSTLPKIFFTEQNPSVVPCPELVKLNDSLIEELGFSKEMTGSTAGLLIFSGNYIPDNIKPLAQAYAGHQFGHFTMLGDGRAILLGEHITPGGERFDIQLKGSGRTPYSRGGDGKATLGPMLREYIISEAMNSLGIPTTRSLAVVKTGEIVYREKELPGAILTRIAQSHIRVGTFQYASQFGSIDDLKALADYTINRHFPYLNEEDNKYIKFLKEVIKKQAELIARWQLVGFIHGVMNTDNMLISGETIDYGPCAFMDIYNSDTVFSSIDIQGRYAYGNQPNIAVWNLARFAETLLPLIDSDRQKSIDLAQEAIKGFKEIYTEKWVNGMRKKLGLFNEEENDEILIEALLSIMSKYKADYTNTFRLLTLRDTAEKSLLDKDEYKQWYKLWNDRLHRQNQDEDEVQQLMQANNPVVIPRNHLVEEALEAAVDRNDFSVMDNLLKVLMNPYDYNKTYANKYLFANDNNCNYKTYCGT